jgi:hypothetical protein
MGLAISRGLVQAHGGSLWVEETPGGGATFRLRVPIAAGAGHTTHDPESAEPQPPSSVEVTSPSSDSTIVKAAPS